MFTHFRPRFIAAQVSSPEIHEQPKVEGKSSTRFKRRRSHSHLLSRGIVLRHVYSLTGNPTPLWIERCVKGVRGYFPESCYGSYKNWSAGDILDSLSRLSNSSGRKWRNHTCSLASRLIFLRADTQDLHVLLTFSQSTKQESRPVFL